VAIGSALAEGGRGETPGRIPAPASARGAFRRAQPGPTDASRSAMSDETGDYASPPCFAHEIEGEYATGRPALTDPAEVARWRKAERERLIAARLAVPAEERRRVGEEVAAELDRLIAPGPGMVISLYWPFRGELDLRGWMTRAAEAGARIALPVVVAKARPLSFRDWTPGCRMGRGVWNIPIPEEGETLVPDVTLAPLIGVDRACYRLGYGGGFYDRTLASLSPRPRTIGVAHPVAEIPTIHPLAHDIPMHVVVTGAGRVFERCAGR
jgi:5,10-methenyltetrahydrofolate synthetase